MMKIANIVGARPQFIKYFPVSDAIKSANINSEAFIKDILVHTGQHYDYTMSKVFFEDFGIREPDYHLEVGSGTHGVQTGQIIKKVEEVILKEKPEIILVYGDTNSTLGSAVAASKLHIPIVHVEAGLRSFNKYMPEELNRILTDHASTLLLCPSKTAVKHLRNEGFKNVLNSGELVPLNYSEFTSDLNNPAVINVGDVMYDVLLYAVEIAQEKSGILEQLNVSSGNYSLLTLHRAENTDNYNKFEEIISFVNETSLGETVIFPMHPRTKKAYEGTDKKFTDNIKIVDPVGYFDILMLLKNCSLVTTDSGGMQKEAYWLRVHCITMRDETEWVETVESGWNVLYKDYGGSHKALDVDGIPYGDGKTAERVVNLLKNISI